MGQRRRDLIAIAQHKRIEEIEADSGYADDDLPLLPGGRIRDHFDAELPRSAELAELRHAHACFLVSMPARCRLWHKRAVKSQPATARGYFAIGIEGASKAVNLGNLLRSAHAFGASFVFTVGAEACVMDTIADTSKASSHLPLYHWQSIDELRLPRGCRLVGIEFLDEAVELPLSLTRYRRPMCSALSGAC